MGGISAMGGAQGPEFYQVNQPSKYDQQQQNEINDVLTLARQAITAMSPPNTQDGITKDQYTQLKDGLNTISHYQNLTGDDRQIIFGLLNSLKNDYGKPIEAPTEVKGPPMVTMDQSFLEIAAGSLDKMLHPS